jgi:hypothetical protein
LSISAHSTPAVEPTVGEGAARDLQDVEAVLDDAVDGSLVERRAHGEEALRLDFRDEAPRLVAVEPRFRKSLDVLDVHPVLEGGMDEGVEFAKLQLEGEGEVEFARQRAELADDPQAVLDIAHVVVGEFEDEQGLWQSLAQNHRSLVEHVRSPALACAAAGDPSPAVALFVTRAIRNDRRRPDSPGLW